MPGMKNQKRLFHLGCVAAPRGPDVPVRKSFPNTRFQGFGRPVSSAVVKGKVPELIARIICSSFLFGHVPSVDGIRNGRLPGAALDGAFLPARICAGRPTRFYGVFRCCVPCVDTHTGCILPA